jgi:hypothetical protein
MIRVVVSLKKKKENEMPIYHYIEISLFASGYVCLGRKRLDIIIMMIIMIIIIIIMIIIIIIIIIIIRRRRRRRIGWATELAKNCTRSTRLYQRTLRNLTRKSQ